MTAACDNRLDISANGVLHGRFEKMMWNPFAPKKKKKRTSGHVQEKKGAYEQ